jgi:hypothetical protein
MMSCRVCCTIAEKSTVVCSNASMFSLVDDLI